MPETSGEIGYPRSRDRPTDPAIERIAAPSRPPEGAALGAQQAPGRARGRLKGHLLPRRRPRQGLAKRFRGRRGPGEKPSQAKGGGKVWGGKGGRFGGEGLGGRGGGAGLDLRGLGFRVPSLFSESSILGGVPPNQRGEKGT